jgi:outer membrane protein assembly factor BamA
LRTGETTLGLAYDRRDNEPAPTEGMFHDASVRAGLSVFGSAFDYWGVNLTMRFYHWLIPGYRHLVFALRVLFDATGGDVPFSLLGMTGGISGPDGVGGGDSVRGLLAYRLQGNVKLMVTPELRWRFASAGAFEFGVVGGLDSGRVWRALGSADGGRPKLGAALGLRIAWNRDFVVRFDYGLGLSEPYAGGNVYLTFDELF